MSYDIPNNPAVTAAFKASITADGAATKAHAVFYTTCEGLNALHVMADDIKKGGRYYELAFGLVIELALTKAERAALEEPGAMKTGTAKHKAANKVGARLRNIRDNLRKIEGAGKGKPETAPASFLALCQKELRAMNNRAIANKKSDDPLETKTYAAFIAHIKAAADVIGATLRDKA